MTSVSRIFALLSSGVVAGALLGGCVPDSGTASAPPAPSAGDPSELAAKGLFEQAAASWLREAAASPENAAQLELLAAEAFWNAGQASRAGETARAIDPSTLDAEARTRRRLVLVRAALADGAAEDAFDTLPSREDLLALPRPTAALEIAVRAAGEAGRPVEEVRLRAALDPFLAEPDANREALWELLRALPHAALEVGSAGDRARPGAAWFELERLARANRTDFPAFSAALRLWRQQHPDHPAESSVVPELAAQIRREGLPPAHVALLLPLSGTFASAAAAVRDGFLAEWYTEDADRPVVSIHDTGIAAPEDIFRKAVADGADFVVGPLSKRAIARVASLPVRGAPVLLLNALDDGTIRTRDGGPPVYQFALSPEAEARAVAAHARRIGHARAGLLVPETEWGTRVAEAFSEQWTSSGGIVAARSKYRGAAEDLAQPVRTLLEIDASQERARRVRRVLGRAVVHEPFPRGDLDLIFLAGFPREARLLRPQIVFLRASDVPIYSTSHVFTGVPEPQDDLDLDDIVFNDMPWVLDRDSNEDGLRERIFALWPAARGGFVRYYAFGADAYRLQRHLYRMAAHPGEAALSGRTGRLTVGPDSRVRIEMTWARFRNGVPEPVSP